MKKLFTLTAPKYQNTEGRSQIKRSRFVEMMFMAIAMMMIAPSAMKGQTTTLDFGQSGTAAWQHVNGTPKNWANINMSTTNYSAISNAKVGDNINWNYGGTNTLDISRLAFVVNQNGVDNSNNGFDGNDGFYLRREKINNVSISGLYTGNYSKIAVLNLKPGDKVTFNASASNEKINGQSVAQYGVGIRYCKEFDGNVWAHVGNGGNMKFENGDSYPNTNTINIDSPGDLMVSVNKGVYITSIVIENGPRAEYLITESADKKSCTFEFTSAGSLDQNDYAIPGMQVSFGNANDYLMVSSTLRAEMHKLPSWSEDLEKNGTNYQPSAGNFYEFRPTTSGTISVTGELVGSQIHVFVYDPTVGTVGDWVEKQEGKFYRDTKTTNDFSFNVNKGRIYYICQDTPTESGNAYHLHSFTFSHDFYVEQLAKVIDLENDMDSEGWIVLTGIDGQGGHEIKVKRCSSNISPAIETKIQYGHLYMKAPQFQSGKDNAGTVIFDVKTDGGDFTFVATFPYHADFGVDPTNPNRSLGHTWNFIDPRNSDSNIGNCFIREGISSFNTGTTSGILSIGRWADDDSQFWHEVNNREWTYSRRVEGSGGTHDPYYMNTFDMVGDNADMIWETEGLWFDTETNLSIIYNESPEYDQSVTNPVDFVNNLNSDPDRYVGLLPDANGKSSFTIPALKNGDRVLIFMKSGIKMSDDDNDHGIFLKIHGAKDAIGQHIDASDLCKAGGTNYIGGSSHKRYEGCYHFIKEGDGDMTFDMVGGSMCKLMYIRIYSGDRISTNGLLSNKTIDGVTVGGNLLYMNDKGATTGDNSRLTLHYSGKVQHSAFEVLTYSGNLNDNSFSGDNFKQSGAYEQFLDFTSKVGEIGMFRMRAKDLEYNKKYVADFVDRNFTVGYRDKVDSYPYTWDFTDIQGFSSTNMTNEATNYSAANGSGELDPANAAGYEISLFDDNGNMKVHSGVYPEDCNHIFDANKIGFGNQLWAGGDVIPETRGLWFYTDDNDQLYNDCMQITDEGIRFANVPDDEGKRVAWWNYKMVVPDVPADGAVYLRMTRDDVVSDDAKTWSEKDGADVPFVATRFQFASQSSKTQLSTDTEVKGDGDYAFYKVDGSDNDWILAVKNTTGNVEHLTFTLNGWIVKKLAVSTDSKTLNKLGWATESRNRYIDPELTQFFTGEDVEVCKVTGFDYPNKTVTLNRVTVTNSVMEPVGTESSNSGYEAYLIHNTEDKAVEILNNGFHLFVPDMHDYVEGANSNVKSPQSMSDSKLKAQLASGSVNATDNAGNTNFVLTYKFRQVDSNDNVISDIQEAKEVGFYRVLSSVSSKGNQGYLPVPTSEWKKKTSSTAKFALIFVDEEEEETGVVTGVESVSLQSAEKDVFYNLNGQKLNGAPTESGIYIRNGKKVLVKMF